MSQEVVFRLHMGVPGCACRGNPAPSLDVCPPPPATVHWVCADRCGQVGVALVNKHGGVPVTDPTFQAKPPGFKNQLSHK